MDTFFEQIVAIRKGTKALAGFIGIWILALIISAVILLFLVPIIGTIAFLLVCGVIYGAYRVSKLFSVEYEYIITNGTMDIDKIIAKSSRKRVASFELSNVERIEKYNPNAKPVGNYTKTVIACNETDPGTYFLVVGKEGKGTTLAVFTPDDRIKGAIVKFVPKFIANSAFKD